MSPNVLIYFFLSIPFSFPSLLSSFLLSLIKCSFVLYVLASRLSAGDIEMKHLKPQIWEVLQGSQGYGVSVDKDSHVRAQGRRIFSGTASSFT